MSKNSVLLHRTIVEKYTFEEIKELLLKAIHEEGWEAELRITINENDYMIIIYEDHCSFAKCGFNAKEYKFKTLDDLYKAKQVE